MTRARAAAVTATTLAAVLGGAPAAHADDPHTLTASCEWAWSAAGPIVVTGYAVAGEHLRPVSTSVTCTVIVRYYGPIQSFSRELPGAVAVVEGVVSSPLIPPTVCLSAWSYWSDGHREERSGCTDVNALVVTA